MKYFNSLNCLKALLTGTLFSAACMLHGQTPPALPGQPLVWYSFNSVNGQGGFSSKYGSSTCSGTKYQLVDDRHNGKAIRFTGSDGHLNIPQSKLFGAVAATAGLPENFTISCWVNINPDNSADIDKVYKIFYSKKSNSSFGLFYYGQEIFLVRTTGQGKHYAYRFWPPASFDAGPGWYHVILVMGARSRDKMKFTKLYIGKPATMKYDLVPPRKVSTTTDPLASDFGGGYALFGQQVDMRTSVEWGIGNADPDADQELIDPDPKLSGIMHAVPVIDDFIVWDEALDDNQAKKLFDCMRNPNAPNPEGTCWSLGTTSQAAISPVPVTLTHETPLVASDKMILFPNPTAGDLSLSLPASGAEGAVTCTLVDLEGKIIFTYRTLASKSGQVIRLPNIKSITKKAGVFQLRVVSPDRYKTFKVIVN